LQDNRRYPEYGLVGGSVRGGYDAFVAKLNAAGTTLAYSLSLDTAAQQ
jgi:hypothetical protein